MVDVNTCTWFALPTPLSPKKMLLHHQLHPSQQLPSSLSPPSASSSTSLGSGSWLSSKYSILVSYEQVVLLVLWSWCFCWLWWCWWSWWKDIDAKKKLWGGIHQVRPSLPPLSSSRLTYYTQKYKTDSVTITKSNKNTNFPSYKVSIVLPILTSSFLPQLKPHLLHRIPRMDFHFPFYILDC